jgi:hypothetical protein
MIATPPVAGSGLRLRSGADCSGTPFGRSGSVNLAGESVGEVIAKSARPGASSRARMLTGGRVLSVTRWF